MGLNFVLRPDKKGLSKQQSKYCSVLLYLIKIVI